MHDPFLFALAVLALLGTPGPTNSLLATSGALAGVRRSLKLVVAEAIGYGTTILLVGVLLGPVLAATPGLAGGLRLVVALYLAHVSWGLWRRGALLADAAAAPVRFPAVLVATLLNPKALVIALAVMPFGHPALPAFFLLFLALLAACALGWIALGAALGRVAGRAGLLRLVPRAGSVVVAGFALLVLAGSR